MMKSLLTIFCYLLFATLLRAQTGWLPAAQFSGNTHLCDDTPWKLVFSEDFNGNRIDTTKWITFVSWPGMPGGDNEHWNAARSDSHMNYIYRDSNVVVKEGTCKLLIRRETGSWTCSGCDKPLRYRRHTSAGALATYYSLPDGSPNSYNTGKLEARIRFPVFEGAWCAFWTWYGTSVNEIDVAEAWGGGLVGSDQRRNKYGTHAWWRDTANNPYQLPYDAAMGGNKFPGQEWWARLVGRRRHAQDGWHVYTCEWDDNLIRFYVDGSLLQSYWKYIKGQDYPYNGHNYRLTIGSGCDPDPGTPYYINYGFPYNTSSLSQVRLMSGVDHRVATLNAADRKAGKDSILSPDQLGQMEIDYVRIWQRHPELDNHKELPELGGLSPAYPDSKEADAADPDRFLQPAPVALFPYAIHIVQTADSQGQRQFHFFESNHIEGYPRRQTFEWDIDIALHNDTGQALQHYKLYGQFAATPVLPQRAGSPAYLSWTLKISEPGKKMVTQSGERYFHTSLKPQPDTRVAYADAFITDRSVYEQTVHRYVQQINFSEQEVADTVYLHSRIGRVVVEALEPYINVDTAVVLPAMTFNAHTE